MIVYYFTGKLTDVNGDMNWFMPGLAVGTFFSGTMVLTPDVSNPKVITADLKILADNQLIKARSIGLNPIKDFADKTPTGPFSSPTVENNGIIDNAFFKVALKGASLGSAGFTIQGNGPLGSITAGAATGSIQSIAIV
jgi:hypothetical protein